MAAALEGCETCWRQNYPECIRMNPLCPFRRLYRKLLPYSERVFYQPDVFTGLNQRTIVLPRVHDSSFYLVCLVFCEDAHLAFFFKLEWDKQTVLFLVNI
ncbi:Hypothetical predicted protein [Podarcis lilfordi]|uniref:Uncharacterized protein n=1 Tax=Podarcis lilfordi TaxID=74358 RepID=A0AA35JNB9_9SAUR|nr:Hypothetical predicted protein [Podarcis lilfordi]